MTIPVLNKTVQKLLQQIQKEQHCEVDIQYKDSHAGFVRHDQVRHYFKDGKLVLEVLDQTDVNYVISHELLHVMLSLQPIPKISFNLRSGHPELDRKYIATGMELYDILMHFFVYQRQCELGLINNQVAELYLKGILAVLKPEPDEGHDEWNVLRTVNILDALVFFQANQEEILPKLQELYPQTTFQAQKLFKLITLKPLDSTFNIRRALVRLYKGFDEALASYGLYEMNLNTYVSVTPVLSKHQLNLMVRQLFDIFHTDLQEKVHFKNAYVGRMKTDQQNTFVIPQPKGNEQTRTKIFQKIYETPVDQYLNSSGVFYLKR